MTAPREPYLDDGGRIVIQDPYVAQFGTDGPDPAAWAEPRQFLLGRRAAFVAWIDKQLATEAADA